MSEEARKAQTLTAKLLKALRREREDISTRNVKRLPDLIAEKERLLAALDSIRLPDGGVGLLAAGLAEARALAEENARRLDAMRQGAVDARKRIEAIAEKQRRAGLYGADGDGLKTASPGFADRNI